jgi:hypothetical protein
MSSIKAKAKANLLPKNLTNKALVELSKADKAAKTEHKMGNSKRKLITFFMQNALLKGFYNKTDRNSEKKINENNKENNNFENDINRKVTTIKASNTYEVDSRNDRKSSDRRNISGILSF